MRSLPLPVQYLLIALLLLHFQLESTTDEIDAGIQKTVKTIARMPRCAPLFALEWSRGVFARKPGYDPTLCAALTLGMCGCEDEAQVITDELTKAYPEHTIINSVLTPIVKAGIALAKGEPPQAITELEARLRQTRKNLRRPGAQSAK